MGCYNKCEGGLLYKVNKASLHRFVFRCECAFGERHSYPKWKSVDAAEFDDEFREEVVMAGNKEGAKLLFTRFSRPKILDEPDESGDCPF